MKQTFNCSAKKYVASVTQATRKLYARTLQRFNWIRFLVSSWALRRVTLIVSLIFIILILTTLRFIPEIDVALQPYFTSHETLNVWRSLLLAIGSALIGAAAIAFSLVMFAMQINIERMPYGLFRKVGSDWRLVGAFTGTFLIAVGLAATSLIPSKEWIGISVLVLGWGIVLILTLFLFAYRRALKLVNPLMQLRLISHGVQREMRIWDRRARRFVPLLEDLRKTSGDRDDKTIQSKYDLNRTAYFQINSHWTTQSRRAVSHLISYARRYAEVGDYEIAGEALNTLVHINAYYVATKGKTFFSSNIFIENPLATDEFINHSLEELRKIAKLGISRGDEQQVEQSLQALAAIASTYLNIDYADNFGSKTHANLASTYLSEAVKATLPHDMVDVVMEGVRLLGQTAQNYVATSSDFTDINTIIERIGTISCAGVLKESHRPITLIGVEQLAKLNIALIESNSQEIRFTVSRVKENVSAVAKLLLELPDSPLAPLHSQYLDPYYSSTMLGWVTNIANTVLNADAADERIQIIISHFEQWSEELCESEKEIFLKAIEKNSSFTIQIIFWIEQVTLVLLSISNAPACNDHIAAKLRDHALWLISVFSWVPDEENAIAFVGARRITETLFRSAAEAHQRNCHDIGYEIRKLLTNWGFKAGKHQTGWSVLERSLLGLSALVLLYGDDQAVSELKTAISAQVASDKALQKECFDHIAREIRRQAATLNRKRHGLSHIDAAMGAVDENLLRPLLDEIANLLSPDTSAKPVEIDLF